VTAAGRIAWQTALATHGTAPAEAISPLPAGPVAVFAQDGTVHGLRLTDGHPLWAWPGGQAVYGMWRWGGLVAVLTGQVGRHARITGLDAATGAVRWVLRLPGNGLLGSQVPTGDGGLAMIRSDGVLQVVSLTDGKVRWARFAGRWPALAAAAGVVMFAMGERLTGYDARTGQIRWTLSGLPGQTQVQVLAGLGLVTSNGSGPYTQTALAAVDPATGRAQWRFDPGSAVTVLADGPAGLAVAIPPGYAGLVLPRSGLAMQKGVTVLNAPGLIDSGYRGELKVLLINHGAEPVELARGERIAQLVVQPVTEVKLVEVDRLAESERGMGGFGSTGA